MTQFFESVQAITKDIVTLKENAAENIDRNLGAMIDDSIKIDPTEKDIEDIEERNKQMEMMTGMQNEGNESISGQQKSGSGNSGDNLITKSENLEPSNLSLSFSCSSNMLANSSQIYFSQHQTQIKCLLGAKFLCTEIT